MIFVNLPGGNGLLFNDSPGYIRLEAGFWSLYTKDPNQGGVLIVTFPKGIEVDTEYSPYLPLIAATERRDIEH